MEFSDAASYFDETPVYDAYTGALLFYGRTATHDDHSSSGATSRRRTLTTSPGNAAPARGVVTVHGENWVVGTDNTDIFQGDTVRRSFDLKKVTDTVELLTPGQAALGAAGTTFYTRLEFYRDQTDTMTSADYDTMWNVFCPQAEAVQKGYFLLTATGRYNRVRNAYAAQERLDIAETDQLDVGARMPVTFVTGKVLNLVTDKYDTTSVATFALKMDVQKFFLYRVQSESDYKPGDSVFMVAKTALTPAVGMEFTADGATWRAQAVVPELDAWAVRARLK